MCHSSVHLISNVISVATRCILKHQMLLWVIFILGSFGESLGDSIKPQNIAVLAGTRVQLDCSSATNASVIWKFDKERDENFQKTIYNVILSDLHYNVEVTPSGDYQLGFVCSEATAGRYTCIEGSQNIGVADVIMLDAKPICTKKAAIGGINVSCSVGFRGHWDPDLQWPDENGRQAHNEYFTQNNTVTSSAIVKTPTADYSLTCQVVFTEKTKPVGTTAPNIPDYRDTCSIEVLSTDKGQSSHGGGSSNSWREVLPGLTASMFSVCLAAISSFTMRFQF